MAEEIWKNSTMSQVVIQRTAANGIRHEIITGGRSFSISPEDRRMNQNLAASDTLDVFANGMLHPVKLDEDTEPEVVENPNHISDEQLPGFFKLHYRTFEKRINEISNPIVLQRLLEIGSTHDATVRQMEMVKARHDVLLPPLSAPEVDDSDGMPRIKPVTPR